MDYETFGEHQWSSTGIFNFLKSLPGEILKNKDNNFMTPSEVIKNYKPVAELDIPDVISWADVERDLSAWLGNKMQQSSIKKIYELEPKIKEQKNKKILEEWRKLQISDHFYYMCTKWFNDGDVHKYFNPHDSPYEAFINYMNIFSDLNTKLNRN
jgi:alpha-amylase